MNLNDDGPTTDDRRAAKTQVPSTQKVARKRRDGKTLHADHPRPWGSGQDWKWRRKLLRSDSAFCGLSFLYRSIIERVYEKYGHGPRFGNDGFCWFISESFAEELGVNRKTILGAFEAAETAGVLSSSRWIWADSKRQAPNSYQLHERLLKPSPFHSGAVSVRRTLSSTNLNPTQTTTRFKEPPLRSGSLVPSQIPGSGFDESEHSPPKTDFEVALEPNPNIPPSPSAGHGSGVNGDWTPSAGDLAWHEEQAQRRRYEAHLKTLTPERRAEKIASERWGAEMTRAEEVELDGERESF